MLPIAVIVNDFRLSPGTKLCMAVVLKRVAHTHTVGSRLTCSSLSLSTSYILLLLGARNSLVNLHIGLYLLCERPVVYLTSIRVHMQLQLIPAPGGFAVAPILY